MRIGCALAGMWLLLVGCATDPGAKIAKYQIKTVGVEPRVKASAIRYSENLHDNENAALNAWMLDAVRGKKMKRMAAVMQANNIDVPSMVHSNFAQAAIEIGYEYSDNRPDATFVLELEQHGFDQRSTFSNMKVPFAVLTGRLVTAGGKEIWHGSSQGKNMIFGRLAYSGDATRKQVGVRDWEEYERDPEKLRQDWQIVVAAAVRDLLRAAKAKGS